MKMFKLLVDLLFINNVGAQMLVGGTRDDHGCVMDGGYSWCEELNSCIRPWETECNTLVVTEPGPVIDPPVCNECPPPMPCPMPYIPEFNMNNCKFNNNVDECGCQISCPSYDCSIQNVPTIPDNCVTWNDGCNTCQVRNGRADICTLMYCFRQAEPYCMHFSTDELRIGEICYRFCEDGSQEFINRQNDCPPNTICKSNDNGLSYDSCGSRAMTCQSSGH